MGVYAEQTVKKYGFTRKEQDDFSIASFERAVKATKDNLFAAEIVPVKVQTKQGEQIIEKDEHPFSVNPEKIPALPNPAIARPTMSAIEFGAAAQMRLPSSKIPIAAKKVHFIE